MIVNNSFVHCLQNGEVHPHRGTGSTTEDPGYIIVYPKTGISVIKSGQSCTWSLYVRTPRETLIISVPSYRWFEEGIRNVWETGWQTTPRQEGLIKQYRWYNDYVVGPSTGAWIVNRSLVTGGETGVRHGYSIMVGGYEEVMRRWRVSRERWMEIYNEWVRDRLFTCKRSRSFVKRILQGVSNKRTRERIIKMSRWSHSTFFRSRLTEPLIIVRKEGWG